MIDTSKISKEDRAYFAGLFDGEGCVVIHKYISKSKSPIYQLKIYFFEES